MAHYKTLLAALTKINGLKTWIFTEQKKKNHNYIVKTKAVFISIAIPCLHYRS